MSTEPRLEPFAHIRRNRRTDPALRRLAGETGAVVLCRHRRCLRSQRCRGPWEPSIHDEGVSLPTCLMTGIDLDFDDLQCLDFCLSALAGRMEEALTAEERRAAERGLLPGGHGFSGRARATGPRQELG